MKRLIPLFVMGAVGTIGALLSGQDAPAEQTSGRTGDPSAQETMIVPEESYEPVQLTEWLATDVTRVSLSPVWKQKEGRTAEMMRAYAELHEARRQSTELTDANKRANQHLEAKELTIRHLVGGEIHLVDAAREWIKEDHSYGLLNLEMIKRLYPGDTEIERYCHRIIRELEILDRENPALNRDALARARGELSILKICRSFFSLN